MRATKSYFVSELTKVNRLKMIAREKDIGLSEIVNLAIDDFMEKNDKETKLESKKGKAK